MVGRSQHSFLFLELSVLLTDFLKIEFQYCILLRQLDDLGFVGALVIS